MYCLKDRANSFRAVKWTGANVEAIRKFVKNRTEIQYGKELQLNIEKEPYSVFMSLVLPGEWIIELPLMRYAILDERSFRSLFEEES